MSRCRTCGSDYEGRNCNPCRATYMREYRMREAPHEAEKKRQAKYYKKNSKRACERDRKNYYAKHEERKAKKRQYRRDNAQQEKDRWTQWKKDNPQRTKEYFARYYQERKAALRAAQDRMRAEKKDEYNAARRDVRKSTPASELQEQSRKAYRSNPGAYKQRARNRAAKVKGAEGSHTRADVRRQYVMQGGKCFWCDRVLGEAFHIDHLIPISRGGTNGPENIVAACAPCNLSKGAKLPLEWATTRG